LNKDKNTLCSNCLSKTETDVQTSSDTDSNTENYLEMLGDPYCFQCGNIVVKTLFKEDGSPLASCLINYFKGLKKS